MSKKIILALVLWQIIALVGCSTTRVHVPDYYSEHQVKELVVGEKISVDELKCSKNPQACNKDSYTWKTHRQYKKKYYFE